MPRSSRTTARPNRRRAYLEPLLNNEIVSCFAMTEPQGGADPLVFKTRRCATATTG
jgi:alkylation response protein AidB-like acyl-CoA dehydrogenase